MKAPDLPAHDVRTRRLYGSPYTRYALHVNGKEIYAQLSPMSDAEIAERVRAHINPPALPPVKEFWGAPTSKPGRPPKAKGRGADPGWADPSRFDE